MTTRLLSAGGWCLSRQAWSVLLAGVLLTLCLLLPTSAFALMSTGDGGWSWQDPLPQGNKLETVSVIDALHAVAAGDNGAILTTNDGGASWSAHDVGIAAAHINDLSFIDANDGWAVAWVHSQNGGNDRDLILHTSDGGATWATQGPHYLAKAVDFLDASHGWVCGASTVWSTGNGGLTWSAHRLRTNWGLNDVVFTDVSHGWVVGYRETDHGSHNYPIILATTNGGITWRKQYFPAGDTEGQVLNSVSFVDSDHGWAVGSGSSMGGGAAILTTSDGGRTWQAQTSPATDYLDQVTFVDASHGWLPFGSSVLATSDGGSTWTAHAVGVPVTAVSFSDDLHGCAVGASGSLATTTDGGANWQVHNSISPPTGIPALADITFPDAVHGWAVGDGLILATADGGTTWSAQSASSGLTSVSFPDATHGWAVGGGGFNGGIPVILHTGDGGLSWQTQFAGTKTFPGAFTDVEFIDANHGWAAGSGAPFPLTVSHPIVGVTGDGGAHWKFVAIPHVHSVANAVTFVDAKHGWLASAPYNDSLPSMIFSTSDGGATWKRQFTTNPRVTLHDITFTDTSHGWAVGETGNSRGTFCIVLTTRNGGATWSQQNLSSESGAAGLHVTFTDSSHGWVVCGSTVLATVDGGRHWWTQRAGSEVRAVAFADVSQGWAVAETADWTLGGGGILTTTNGGFGLAPVTTVSGADLLWHKRPVRLTFRAADEPDGAGMTGGQAKTETRIDDGAWTATSGTLTIAAPADHSNDGVHPVFYRSTDAAGNTETARNVIVKIDTLGPTTAAKAAVGKRGQAITLRYFIADNVSPQATAVRVTITNARGVVVKRYRPGSTNTGVWRTLSWRPALRGSYTYAVYAKDLAGNAQVKVGRAKITVE